MAAATMTPMVTFAARVDASAVDPDAELRELGRIYASLRELSLETGAKADRLFGVFLESAPERPEVLKVRPWDWNKIGVSPHARTGEFIQTDNMGRIEEFLVNTRRIYEEHGLNKDDVDRGEEVLAAHKEWSARYDAHRVATGLEAADRDSSDIDHAIDILGGRIMALPARTKAGLRVKASVLDANKWIDEDGNAHAAAEHLTSLLNDLLQAA